jgi:hypothetical protein
MLREFKLIILIKFYLYSYIGLATQFSVVIARLPSYQFHIFSYLISTIADGTCQWLESDNFLLALTG